MRNLRNHGGKQILHCGFIRIQNTGKLQMGSFLTAGVLFLVMLVACHCSPEIKGPGENSNSGTGQIADLRETVSHLQSFETRSTRDKQWAAAHWILSRFNGLGIEGVIETYDFREKTWPNVIATLQGTKSPEEIVMIIAHLDSATDDPRGRAPGADDNGSGVAVLLEVARFVKEVSLERTVMFCVFSNEEQGRAGSKAYSRQARQQRMEIKAVINLDILGYNRPAWPLYWDAMMGHDPLKQKVKSIFRMARNYFLGVIYGKDIMKVAGREPNRKLVVTTSKMLCDVSELKVKAMVRNDCG